MRDAGGHDCPLDRSLHCNIISGSGPGCSRGAGDEGRQLKKTFELRSGLLILVVAHPAFMPVNIFSAAFTAFRNFQVVIDSVGSLKIIARIGDSVVSSWVRRRGRSRGRTNH